MCEECQEEAINVRALNRRGLQGAEMAITASVLLPAMRETKAYAAVATGEPW